MVGIGVGTAASAAIEPIVEPGRQQAWGAAPNRVLTPALYAALVAQGALDLGVGQGLSRREGFNEDQFNRLVHLALRAPPYSEAQDLRRRNKITPDQLRHSFAKAQIEEQYWDALADLVDDRLSAQAVALGIIRSMIADPGFFPVQLDTSGGVIPSYKVSDIDPLTEAAASGFNKERLRVMVGSIGRPPGPNEGARALFRGLIERPDFNRLILEGDTRPEWAQTFLDVSREILTAGQYAELELRGFLDQKQRRAETDKHGMAHEDSDLLVDLLGRSISVHQVTTGLARGGKYPGKYANVPEPYKSAIQRSNIREEWSELDYANRYSYPSAFVLRSLVQEGDYTQAQAEQILLELGWKPELAKLTAEKWAALAGGTSTDPWVKKAESQLWTATHKAYKGNAIDETVARTAFQAIGIDAAAQDQIIALWDAEKNL